MRRFLLLFSCLYLLAVSCGGGKVIDPASLRGLSQTELQQMREEILARHADGSALSDSETEYIEQIRDQERRLENAWVFGEWRERHGARLIFRDDGSVSVGARGGAYDELGVYKFVSPEVPSFESTWTLIYDTQGKPVVVVVRPGETDLIYPFGSSRTSVRERAGDLQESSETGCLFTKVQ